MFITKASFTMFSIIRCCCHDCCNHLCTTCSDHSRILRPGNGFVSVCPLDFSHLQQHPTSSDQVPLNSATTNDVFAKVSDVLQFLVFLQHFLLLSCHCRYVLERQSSSLGNVIEFPSSYTLLESKRKTQLLRSINATSDCKHYMCLNKCLPLLTITPVVLFLPSKSPAHSESTCTCTVSSDVCRAYVNTHLFFLTRYRPNLLSSCMCPLRGSFMCLVRHFTASAMSTLS